LTPRLRITASFTRMSMIFMRRSPQPDIGRPES
jgi:hypothetical protein